MNVITLILIAIGLIIVVSVAGYLCYIGFSILKGNREILNVGKVKESNMEIKKGKMKSVFVITPNINLNWIKFTGTNIYYLQFAWLFWYITFATKKER